MKVVHFSKLPTAGAPWHTVQCLKRYGIGFESIRLVNTRIEYGDKRVFPHDLLIKDAVAVKSIREADIIHIHNYLPNEIIDLIDRKRQKVVATLHSVPRMYNWKELIRYADKTYVIRQPYQVFEYLGELPSLPTLVDIFGFESEPKTEKISISFAPSVRCDIGHPASKGVPTLLPIFKRLQTKHDFIFDYHFTLPHLEDIKTKGRAWIYIDDVVKHPLYNTTIGVYHLSSIFSMMMGTITVNAITPLELRNFYNCEFKIDIKADYPFIEANFKTFESTLSLLLSNLTKSQAIKRGNLNKKWLEKYYNPKELVKEYEKVYEDLLC